MDPEPDPDLKSDPDKSRPDPQHCLFVLSLFAFCELLVWHFSSYGAFSFLVAHTNTEYSIFLLFFCNLYQSIIQ